MRLDLILFNSFLWYWECGKHESDSFKIRLRPLPCAMPFYNCTLGGSLPRRLIAFLHSREPPVGVVGIISATCQSVKAEPRHHLVPEYIRAPGLQELTCSLHAQTPSFNDLPMTLVAAVIHICEMYCKLCVCVCVVVLIIVCSNLKMMPIKDGYTVISIYVS